MHSLDRLLERWSNEEAATPYRRTRDRGVAFERLCATFLTHDPLQSRQFRNVRSWASYAHEHNLPAADTGIDLVAELVEGNGLAAIQCKLRKPSGSIAKAEIDSFLAASGSDRPRFDRRIIIDTTNRPWSANAEDTLRNQTIPVSRLGLHDLKASPIDWERFTIADGEIGEVALKAPSPKTLRPHQATAVQAAREGLREPGARGKVLMACGTGKTLVALRTAEDLAGRGGRVLVLVPSLALLSQTLRAWVEDAVLPLRAFAVCSDAQTGRRRRNDADIADMDALDLAWPATTDASTLARAAASEAFDELTVVFATYQSSGVLEEAQRDHGLLAFDLAIADEAHRTAGALIPGEDPSPFVKIHDEQVIHAERRLYMTATAKVYAESARTKAGKLAATLCSMDDEDRYGPVLHETRFGDAIDRGLLADYQVIVLTVPESLAAKINIPNFAEGAELTLDERGRMIGCLRALAKRDVDEFREGDRRPMRRAIAFCNGIKSSKRIEGCIRDVAEGMERLFEDEASAEGLPATPEIGARHVDGTFNASARARVLEFLEETPEGETRILTNARCLTEGVDVPALDAILFVHPRKSQIEVVQAVGRVMRNAPGKQRGYVILPVVVPTNATPEQALADDSRWRSVWQTLNAIRSHDERFEGEINRMEAGDPARRISIIPLADWRPPSAAPFDADRPASDPDEPTSIVPSQTEIIFESLPAIRTKIVEKCGNRKYWDEWAGDIARIARAHIERIQAVLNSSQTERETFEKFLTELRDDLNPEVTADEAIEMLAQHMVTQPVFKALFGGAAAAQRNPVGQGMQTVLDVLKPARIDVEAESLDPFYASVRRRVEGAATAEARQKIVVELYDKFFRNAFPRVTQKLGVVYTPVEVVDFILHSVEDVLREEFGSGLGEEGVHILDPFTGTGTFLTRMIESDLLAPEQLLRKYGGEGKTPELHANEIVLLAYYIAAVNIEMAFQARGQDRTGQDRTGQDRTGQDRTGQDRTGQREPIYRPFEGICLTDTFALNENDDRLADLFPDNSQRRDRQKQLDIRVIVGNPPWSAGQRSSADNNPNASYPKLESRVAKTYVARSTATLKNSLYDSYKMAIRWASDRIGDQGIVAFVTNGSWLDGNADSGIRACLAEEFSSIHVLNLRGNARTSGELRREEGDNVFDQGSRAPVAVSILVKNPDAEPQGCRIRYHDIGDYLSREEKLGILRDAKSITGIKDWAKIIPNRHHDWISQRDESFYDLLQVGSKEAKAGKTDDAVFRLYSNGYKTGRDAYMYSFSRTTCADNAFGMTEDYQAALRELGESGGHMLKVDEIVRRHSMNMLWDKGLKDNLARHKNVMYSPNNIRQVIYRPFVKQHLYAENMFAQRPAITRNVYPASSSGDNIVICTSGTGSTQPFSVLMANIIPDVGFLSACQCFPRYRYEAASDQADLPGLTNEVAKVDNITDSAFQRFREHYRDPSISKDDVFDYIYGVLHAPDFRERFGSTLSRELPRIPLAADFQTFAQAGRDLAELHLNYETGPEYPLETESAGGGELLREHFSLTGRKMRFEDKDRTALRLNDHVILRGIPAKAHTYQVNGRTPLEWFIDRYYIRLDKQSGIVNDPNGWFEKPEDIVPAIQRIVHVSVETARIVRGLPESLTSVS